MALEHERDEDEDAKREAWSRKAKAKQYTCEVDGEFIEYEDRECYFATGKCSYHASQ